MSDKRRPDHWWRQAVIDVARQHAQDGIGWLLEVCARMDQLNREDLVGSLSHDPARQIPEGKDG